MAKKKANSKKGVKPQGDSAAKPAATSPGGKEDLKKKTSTPAKKGAGKKAAAKQADKGPGFLQKTKQFFREVRVELKKVTWPSRKETMASTSVVLVIVFIIALYLGLVDVALSRVMKWLLN